VRTQPGLPLAAFSELAHILFALGAQGIFSASVGCQALSQDASLREDSFKEVCLFVSQANKFDRCTGIVAKGLCQSHGSPREPGRASD